MRPESRDLLRFSRDLLRFSRDRERLLLASSSSSDRSEILWAASIGGDAYITLSASDDVVHSGLTDALGCICKQLFSELLMFALALLAEAVVFKAVSPSDARLLLHVSSLGGGLFAR